jgi:hypothetical protein
MLAGKVEKIELITGRKDSSLIDFLYLFSKKNTMIKHMC